MDPNPVFELTSNLSAIVRKLYFFALLEEESDVTSVWLPGLKT